MNKKEAPYEKEYLAVWRRMKTKPAWFTFPWPYHFQLAKKRFLENASKMGDKSFHKTEDELNTEQDEEISDAINYEIFKIVRKMK